jgi:hypothetical protein
MATKERATSREKKAVVVHSHGGKKVLLISDEL